MIPWMLALWMGPAWVPSAHAHSLEVTTARITLRDGHVAVTAQLDVLELMQTTRATDDVPLGLLAVVDPAAFDTLAKDTWSAVQRDTTLVVDGAPVVPADWSFPDIEDLRAEAQRAFMAQAVDEHVHPRFSSLSFEAPLSRPPSRIEVALPHAVGPVLMSFVQPVSQLAEAGASVGIHVPSQGLRLAPAAAPRGPVAAP